MSSNQFSPYEGVMSPDVAQALHVREWSTLGTVVVIIWDMFLLFNDEYTYIWSTPSFALKWIYLFARYFVILFQSTCYYFLTHTLSRPPVLESICFTWTLVHIIVTQIMTAVIEGVLMLRVYALYRQDIAVGWLLFTVFLIQRVIAVGVDVRVGEYVRYDEICRAKQETVDVLVLGAGVLFTQAVIWTLTFSKRKVRKESTSNARFMGLLLRDGAWAFAGIVALFSVIVPYAFLVEISSHTAFSWPISLLSIATCRIILNMQGLKSNEIVHPGALKDPEDIELPEYLGSSLESKAF
ncbi:hypothetical protein BDQ12DRAFT_693769 [Crucibulum laeve]|uniref:DUF6533 domain-containing protein n=1 Tax=Crucibulum laeve TaxID=68775 RepID=A0A5C3LHJ2_9AGAR|nr:hypothetical protein BDQ12DRAFT_693769 [Crucibulum laeve]